MPATASVCTGCAANRKAASSASGAQLLCMCCLNLRFRHGSMLPNRHDFCPAWTANMMLPPRLGCWCCCLGCTLFACCLAVAGRSQNAEALCQAATHKQQKGLSHQQQIVPTSIHLAPYTLCSRRHNTNYHLYTAHVTAQCSTMFAT